jgi:hypothetical protein
MKALVLCGGYPQIALLKDLKSRGIETVLADANNAVVAKDYADKFYQVSVLDVDAIKDVAIKEQVDFLITVCADQVLLVVAQISEMLNLPCYIDFATAVVINREIVLELNNKTLTVTKDTDGSGVFKIVEGGNLTINGEGIINGVGQNVYSMAIWVNGGECTINGGTYTNVGAGDSDHYDLIYVKGGKLTINGGEFYGQTPAWLVNTSDSYRDSSTIAIKGGTFHGFNPASNATEGAGTNYVAEGHIVTRTGNVYVVTAE